jgi:competence protein ComEA
LIHSVAGTPSTNRSAPSGTSREGGATVLRELRDWAEELACRAGLDGLPSPARTLKVGAVALVAALVAWTMWGTSAHGGAVSAPSGAPASAPATAHAATQPAAAATVTVHVVGEVRRPGVYELAGGARARDAVAAAGGLLGDADQAAINLARVVADGEQIAVPRQGEAVPASSGGTGGASGPPAKVDLNTATAEQLDALPGIGPATATKIVSDRTANGPFRTVDDLMRVPGIGPAKFDALKDLVRAN